MKKTLLLLLIIGLCAASCGGEKVGDPIKKFEKEDFIGTWILKKQYRDSPAMTTSFHLNPDFSAIVKRSGPAGKGKKKGSWKINGKKEIGGGILKFTTAPGINLSFFGNPNNYYSLSFGYSLIDGIKTLTIQENHYVKTNNRN